MNNKKKPIVEKVWNYKGYNCAVLFHPLGHRCGYVELPKTNKYYQKDVFDNDLNINCNGGLTYSDNYLYGVSTVEDNRWWIGWDYAHCWNRFDYKSYIKYYGKDHNYEMQLEYITGDYIACLNDVIRDCENVVDQLINLEKEN